MDRFVDSMRYRANAVIVFFKNLFKHGFSSLILKL